MTHYQVTQTRVVDAPPQAVYDVFADYHGGHQAILPEAYFKEVVVNEGGFGDGTEVTVTMEVMGVKQVFDLRLREVEPGRVLVEEDANNTITTTFTFEPLQGGQKTQVTITTSMAVQPGLQGFIERLINPLFLRKIYREELENLSRYISVANLETLAT